MASGMVKGRAAKVVLLYRDAFWQESEASAAKSTVALEDLGPIANLFPTHVNEMKKIKSTGFPLPPLFS